MEYLWGVGLIALWIAVYKIKNAFTLSKIDRNYETTLSILEKASLFTNRLFYSFVIALITIAVIFVAVNKDDPGKNVNDNGQTTQPKATTKNSK